MEWRWGFLGGLERGGHYTIGMALGVFQVISLCWTRVWFWEGRERFAFDSASREEMFCSSFFSW